MKVFKSEVPTFISYLVTYFIIYISLVININLESKINNPIFIYIALGLFLLIYSVQIFKEVLYWELLIFAIIYLFIIFGNYFTEMTLNLNNEDFKWNSFQKLWDMSFLPIFGIILLFIFLFKLIIKNNEMHTFLTLYKKSNYFYFHMLSQVATMFIMVSSLFINRFLTNSLFPVGEVSEQLYFLPLLNYSLGLYIFFCIVMFCAVKGIFYLLKNKVTPSLSVASSLLLGFIFNYSIQAGITEQGGWYGYYTASGATIFQIIILTMIFLFNYVMINRYLIATTVNVIVGIFISYVNAVKFSARNEPLLITDLNWVGDISFFKDYVDENTLLVLFTVIIWVVIGLYYFRDSYLAGKIYNNLKLRLSAMSAVVLFFVAILTIFTHEENGEIPDHIPVLSAVYNLYDVNWLGITANARFQSLSFVWLKQLTISDMETPRGYSKDKIYDIYQKYNEIATEINATRTENISDQTIIFILSESLADPERIPGVLLSAPVLPQIQQIQSETTSGLMLSDGYGGGTANMEFQSLTGLPMYNFNDMISVLYTEVVPDMSYIPSISNAFDPENRIVIHLSDATHYSRNSVYQKMQYSKFIATSGSEFEAKNVNILGAYPSDSSTYDNILTNIDVDKNQFFSVMTMQNHGQWFLTDLSDIIANSDSLTSEQNESLTNYARLLSYTDSSTAEFLQQLQGIDKKITVVFYGDHLPGLYPQSIFKDDPESQYLTDYFIWSNYDTAKCDYPLVNSSDFPAELLAHTNSRVSPYYALLTEVLNKASVDKDNLDDEAQEIANNLKMIQYDLTEGKGYILKYSEFFEFD